MAPFLELPGWASIRRKINPLTPILIISHPFSASSIYCDPWHLPCSIHILDSLFVQPLSKSSLVYLLVWNHPLHSLYISSPNPCLLFAAYDHTITTCFAVVPSLCHLFLISQLFTWNFSITLLLLYCFCFLTVIWFLLNFFHGLIVLTDCDGMGMCCEKKTMIVWRNVCCMNLGGGAGQEVDQRKVGERLWKKDCHAHKLNKEDAVDHKRWRKEVRDDFDHDRCEWVNVSSGTGSPELSRTKSREP